MLAGNTLTPWERLSRYLSVLEHRSFALAMGLAKLSEWIGGEALAQRVVSLFNTVFYQSTGMRWDNVLITDVRLIRYDHGTFKVEETWGGIPKKPAPDKFPKGVMPEEDQNARP